MMRLFIANLLILSVLCLAAQSQLYFPPKTGSGWETTAPAALGYCPDRIDSLFQFLETNNSKSFLLLKDGKIVLEKYFGTFTQDSAWYWASAGKTCTGFLVGIAEKDGLLQISQPVNDFLGAGWTSAPAQKEAKITLRHLITMASGLDDAVEISSGNINCFDPSCFLYKSDAGERWAYHTSAYLMSHKIIEKASGQSINAFSTARLFSKIGMKALWANGVLFSKARDMARFGLLLQADGKWATDPVLVDPAFVAAMTETSQPMNKSYGYLTWLAGKESFMLPQTQFVFPTNLVPSAPEDAFFALGKNDQKIHVSRSEGLVVVRQGNASSGSTGPSGGQVPIVFDEGLWQRINALKCTSSSTQLADNQRVSSIFPNPTDGLFDLKTEKSWSKIEVFDAAGQLKKSIQKGEPTTLEGFSSGLYFLKIEAETGGFWIEKAIKN